MLLSSCCYYRILTLVRRLEKGVYGLARRKGEKNSKKWGLAIDDVRMTPQLWDKTQDLPGLNDSVPVDMEAAKKKAEKAANGAFKKAMKKSVVIGDDAKKDKKGCAVM